MGYKLTFLNGETPDTWRMIAFALATSDNKPNNILLIFPETHDTSDIYNYRESCSETFIYYLKKYYKDGTNHVSLAWSWDPDNKTGTILIQISNGPVTEVSFTCNFRFYTKTELLTQTAAITDIATYMGHAGTPRIIVSNDSTITSNNENTIITKLKNTEIQSNFYFLSSTGATTTVSILNPYTTNYTNFTKGQVLYSHYLANEIIYAIYRFNYISSINMASVKLIVNNKNFLITRSSDTNDLTLFAKSIAVFPRCISELWGKISTTKDMLVLDQKYTIVSIIIQTSQQYYSFLNTINQMIANNANWIDGYNFYNLNCVQNIESKNLIFLTGLISQTPIPNGYSYKIPIILNETPIAKTVIPMLIGIFNDVN